MKHSGILQIKRYEYQIKSAPIVIFDANIPIDGIGTILELCEKYERPGKKIKSYLNMFLFQFYYQNNIKCIRCIKWTAL